MRRLLITAAMSLAVTGIAAPAAQAADPCPNAQYRNGPGANLPDCRAWEQVTPVAKGGERSGIRASYPSANGDRLIFAAKEDPSDINDGRYGISLFSSVRGSAWATLGLESNGEASGSITQAPTTKAVSPDRSKVLAVSLRKYTPDAVEGASNVYARDTADRSYTLLATVPGQQFYYEQTFVDGSLFWGTPDFSRVVMRSNMALTPDAPSGGTTSAYMMGGGRVTLVSRDVNDAPLNANVERSPDFVSEDGRRVTFRAATDPQALYQRVDGTSTVLISRSHRGDDPTKPFVTLAASPSLDGTEVTFLTKPGDELTNVGPPPFYRWSANGDALVSLFAGVSPPWSASATAFSLLRVSSDRRYVWFSFSDQDAGGASFGRLAVLDTSAKRVSIRATFAGDNANDTFTSAYSGLRFSPDGTKLLAATPANLTGYDQSGPACASAGGRCREAFFFDARQPDADPICISCGGPGTSSVGTVDIGGLGGITDLEPSQPIANTGQVVFGTSQRLSTNDVSGPADVYLYTPGRGVSLISSGIGTYTAGAPAIAPSGESAFFATGDSLVPQDNDADSDFYVARVGGGLAAQQVVPVTASPCSAGRCPADATPAPAARVPGTATFGAPVRPPSFVVERVSRSARQAAARSGRLAVVVKVGAAGKLSARADAKVGRRTSTVANSSLTARKAGRFGLTLKLSRTLRAALARERGVAVTVTVSYSRAAKPIRQTVKLTAPRTRGATKGGAR